MSGCSSSMRSATMIRVTLVSEGKLVALPDQSGGMFDAANAQCVGNDDVSGMSGYCTDGLHLQDSRH